jgi:ribosomal protein S6--L-glutamate ligase
MSALAGKRIQLWVEPRGGVPAVNPVMRALLDDLAAAGASTAVRVPEWELINPDEEHQSAADLVLLKTATTLGLSLAVAGEAHGESFLNPAAVTLRVHDKAATTARLAAAGLPVPPTFLCGGEGALSGSEPPRSPDLSGGWDGAWVSKPTRGVHGRGVVFHAQFPRVLREAPPALPRGVSPAGSHSAAAAGEQPAYVVDDGTRLVQRHIGAGAPDVKAYVAGGRLFAGAKRFSASSYVADEIEQRTLRPAERDVIFGVGEALALRCYGVDLRYDGERPFIVDANPFPGYRGFPDAVPALRREIEFALEASGRTRTDKVAPDG